MEDTSINLGNSYDAVFSLLEVARSL
jgi:hypothetical protein